MRYGIELEGRDFAAIGINEEESTNLIMTRLELIETFGLTGGGAVLGTAEKLNVNFICDLGHKDVDVALCKKFTKAYRKKFPTFDGTISIVDVDHLVSDDEKFLNAVFRKK